MNIVRFDLVHKSKGAKQIT